MTTENSGRSQTQCRKQDRIQVGAAGPRPGAPPCSQYRPAAGPSPAPRGLALHLPGRVSHAPVPVLPRHRRDSGMDRVSVSIANSQAQGGRRSFSQEPSGLSLRLRGEGSGSADGAGRSRRVNRGGRRACHRGEGKALRHSGRPREPGQAAPGPGRQPARTIISHARPPPLWTHIHVGHLVQNTRPGPPGPGELRPIHIERFKFHPRLAFRTHPEPQSGRR